MQNFIITTPHELKTLFQEVLDNHLTNIKKEPLTDLKTAKIEVKFYSRIQTSEMLGITLATLHKYTKQGIIKSHRIGNRVLFKMIDIENALTNRKF